MNKVNITILIAFGLLILGYWAGQMSISSSERSCRSQGGTTQWLGKWNDARYRVLICEFPGKDEMSYPWDKPGRKFENE